ncbi:MAG: NUDIX hydrolase [Actinobacteria bacterium]|nr:MAG: NUDIX hydrolase [Actinomycetota bacterium]
MILAGGGVVSRLTEDGGREVVLVHRPAYDDWTFPKGKLDGAETEAQAALREVEEETGLRCSLGDELGLVSYEIGPGLTKSVRYWVMGATDGTLAPAHEVDEARWVAEDEARAMLSYEHDRDVLDRFSAPLVTVSLIRHAKAGSRHAWHGRDRLRPLSQAGRAQASGLVDAFDGRPTDRLLSSPYLRCVETLEPLALSRSLAIETTKALAEGAPVQDALRLIEETARGGSAALCTHGDVLTGLIRHLRETGVSLRGDLDGKEDFRKGSIWHLELRAGVVLAAEPGPPRDRA